MNGMLIGSLYYTNIDTDFSAHKINKREEGKKIEHKKMGEDSELYSLRIF